MNTDPFPYELQKIYFEPFQREMLGTTAHVSHESFFKEHHFEVIPFEGDPERIFCRAPERTLIDLSNFRFPFPVGKMFPVRYWDYLQQELYTHISRYNSGVDYSQRMEVLQGPFHDCQIKVASCSQVANKRFYKELSAYAAQSLSVPGEPILYQNPMLHSPVVLVHNRVRERLKELQVLYSPYILNEHRGKIALYQDTSIIAHSVWDQVAELGEVFVFLLQDGLPHGLGFEYCTGEQASFVEFHAHGDHYRTFRPGQRAHDFINLQHIVLGKGSVLIDESISGITLHVARENLNPELVVGVFPKSLRGVAPTNYITFCGELVNSKDVPQHNRWFIELFKGLFG